MDKSGALIDTSVLLDYLLADKRAQRAIGSYAHRSISVVTWLELMALCPPATLEPTRGFLRTFERLSINESIADAALLLGQRKPGLSVAQALTWASAQVNQLVYVTADARHVAPSDRNVVVPYRWDAAPAGRRAAKAAA